MTNSTIAKIAITAVVAVAGLGFFVKSTFDHGSRYSPVADLVSKENLDDWTGHEFKVSGYVLPGSLREQVVNQETVRTFVVHEKGKQLRVYSSGPKPDTFKDQSEILATGRLVPVASKRDLAAMLGVASDGTDLAYVFEATDLQAKCPSRYAGAESNKTLDTSFH